MEHLFYFPEDDVGSAEVEALTTTDFAVTDWDAWDEAFGLCPHREVMTSWLGYNHDQTRTTEFNSLDDYVRRRDMAFMQPEIYKPGFNNDQVLPFLQSWMYLGLSEQFLGRPVRWVASPDARSLSGSQGALGNAATRPRS